MSTAPILLWDAGPGEVRAGLIEQGALTEFRIIRPRHPEKALYQAGELYTARIVERTGRTALVDLGPEQAILDLLPAGFQPGQLIEVVMTRSALPEPGRWKLAKVRAADDPAPRQRVAAWHFSAEPWQIFLRQMAPKVSALICPTPLVALNVERELAGGSPPVRVDPQAIVNADFDELVEQSAAGIFVESGLSIERTRAMTVIDVDGTGDPVSLNIAAAREIPRLLRMLDIGGPVAIDFVTMDSRSARHDVATVFDEAAKSIGAHERTAINGFGLMQLIRPRTGPSIPEILCATTPGRLSTASRAIALLREAGRTHGVGKRILTAPPAIIDLIRSWPWETMDLQSSLGCNLDMVPDSTASGYGHVHVVQN